MTARAFENPALNRNIPLTSSPLAEVLVMAGQTLALWETRVRTRRALKDLDPGHYADVGLTTAEVLHEIEKPFWVA